MDVYGEDNYSGYSFLCVKNLSCIFSFNSCKVSIGNDISHCEVRQRNNKLNEKTMHRMGENICKWCYWQIVSKIFKQLI